MPRPLISLENRFWDKVSFPDDPDDCWIWTGAIDSTTGYGRIGLGSRAAKTAGAHRVSYELTKGPLDDGMDACHNCNNQACVNPRHIYEGTRKDNMQQAKREGRLKRPFRPWSEQRRANFLAKRCK